MKRRILSLLLALTMVLTLLPATALAEGEDCTDENCTHVAAIGNLHYATLQDAITDATSDQTVELLDNMADIGRLTIDKKITIDGNNHRITGNSSLSIQPQGATLRNIVFEKIHNDQVPSTTENTRYGFENKVGKLTAVYGSGLTGKLEIIDCTFDSIDWDAIQITPKASAEIVITGNTFSNTSDVQAVRYIHIESSTNVAFSADITDNDIYDGMSLKETGFEVYYFSDPNAVNLSGNYIAEPTGCCILSGSGTDQSAKIFPLKATSGNTSEVISGYPVMAVINQNNYFFTDLNEAVDTAAVVARANRGTTTYSLLDDLTLGADVEIDKVTVPAGTTATLDLSNATFTGNIVVNGTLTIEGNGKVDGTFTVGSAGALTITGGSFSSEVPGEYMPAGYACVKKDGMYVVGEAPNGAMVVKQETGDSGEVSATLDGIYKGENTTITGGATGEGESTPTGGNVSIDLSSAEGGGDSTSLIVTQTAAASLANNGANSLTVKTDVGSVKLDADALDKVGGTSGDVKISIVEDEASAASSAASYTVEVKSGTTDLLPEGQANGQITITIPCPESLKDKTDLFVYYIKNNIPYQRMNATKTDDGQITFTTTHLSQYAVYGTKPATDYEATVTDAAGVATPYSTLAEAISKAQNEDTVTLQKEVNLTGTLIINTSYSFALDLNGKTLSGRVNLLRGNLTIKNGTVKHEGGQALNVYGSESDQANYSVLKIEEDVTIEAAYGICIFPEYEGSTPKPHGYGIIVDVEGKINQGGIFVSGNLGNSPESSNALSQSNNVPVVYVRSGAVVNNTSPNQGIAMNGYAVVNVYEGANIRGNEAIGVKRGQLNIYGGTFQAIGEKVDPVEANNNGTEKTGATISVTSTYNYAGKIEINITGGTFTSTNSAAFYVGHSQASGRPTSYQQGLSIDLEGGTFSSPNGQTAVYVADAIEGDKEDYTKEIVSGGSFSSSVSEYVIDSLNAELKKSTGATPYSYYTDVEKALEHASAGDVVIDLSDPAGEASEPITAATVTYDDGGHGTAPARHNVTVGEKITLRDMEDADGYAFMGWSMGGNTYQPGDTFTVTAARTTFTAVWELKATPIEPVTDVGYLVEHYLEGRWGYELVETEFFMDKIGTTVTAQAKDYPGYRCNWLLSTFSGTLVKPESDSDVVILKLYYDKWSPSPTDDSDDDRYQLPTWDITVEDIANGSVAVFPQEAKPTTTVTITAEPDKGYEVDEVIVTDESGNELTATEKADNQYTFRMPNSDVTIAVTFQPVSGGTAGADLAVAAPAGWVNPYSDVAAGDWYYDAVGYASANGLMSGTSATTFAPAATMNRAMVWTVIARLDGQTIAGESWAEDARAWAVAQGVSDGTNPDGTVTREELVTMLYRYIGSPAMNVPELGLIGNYPDSAAVSAWAQNAFAWALSRGIIDGRDGKLAAGESVTRAEAATILARFHLAV